MQNPADVIVRRKNHQHHNDGEPDTKADLLAQGALDIIVGDLRQEIVNGSTINGIIYSPTLAANMLPQRSGNP